MVGSGAGLVMWVPEAAIKRKGLTFFDPLQLGHTGGGRGLGWRLSFAFGHLVELMSWEWSGEVEGC